MKAQPLPEVLGHTLVVPSLGALLLSRGSQGAHGIRGGEAPINTPRHSQRFHLVHLHIQIEIAASRAGAVRVAQAQSSMQLSSHALRQQDGRVHVRATAILPGGLSLVPLAPPLLVPLALCRGLFRLRREVAHRENWGHDPAAASVVGGPLGLIRHLGRPGAIPLALPTTLPLATLLALAARLSLAALLALADIRIRSNCSLRFGGRRSGSSSATCCLRHFLGCGLRLELHLRCLSGRRHGSLPDVAIRLRKLALQGQGALHLQ
mmetsp:Transcript_7345/g.26771  ORF Transcript_7345/g.26771 Transcript_7345/m.26771 type:complete len:264 (-) Transcript_7345:393-1184(-)